MKNKELERAITLGGGIVAFASAMGVTHQAVSAWRKKGHVPIARALEIEQKFGVPTEGLVSEGLAYGLATCRADGGDLI